MKRGGVLILLALAGCSAQAPAGQGNAVQPSANLEKAAIERGLVRDPADSDIAGLYGRDTDRICIVPAGFGYRVGAFVDYGDGITCSGSGRISRVGATLHVELGRNGACSFDARFDGDRIVFPAEVPDGCRKLCKRRARFGALDVTRISDSIAEAAALRDSRGWRLCASGAQGG